jgi:hypothetical protein
VIDFGDILIDEPARDFIYIYQDYGVEILRTGTNDHTWHLAYTRATITWRMCRQSTQTIDYRRPSEQRGVRGPAVWENHFPALPIVMRITCNELIEGAGLFLIDITYPGAPGGLFEPISLATTCLWLAIISYKMIKSTEIG